MSAEASGSSVVEMHGERCLLISDDHTIVRDAEGGRALIEAALGERATLIAVPASVLDDEFFRLRSGLAGEILQKAVNYRLKFAVIGDVSAHVNASDALRDLVTESNRGRSIFFVNDRAALNAQLADLHASRS
jgi:hypothetical protein